MGAQTAHTNSAANAPTGTHRPFPAYKSVLRIAGCIPGLPQVRTGPVAGDWR